MTVMMKSKEDIEFHSDYMQKGVPAVNVKVYGSYRNVRLPIHLGSSCGKDEEEWTHHYTDPEFTHDWIDENVSDNDWNDYFEWACTDGWEQLQAEACNIYGHDMIEDRSGRHYRYRVYSQGRSGGWAIIDGIDADVDSWDAIEFTRWKRFSTIARSIADGIPYDMVLLAYEHKFQKEEDEGL